MVNRPTFAHIRNALARGVCPWCSYSTEGVTSEMCPECGNNLRAPLGPKDPGSHGLAWTCSILAALLIMMVAVIQQRAESPVSKKGGPNTPASAAFGLPSGQFELTAKMFVKLATFTASADPKGKRQLGDKAVQTLEAQANDAVDRVRIAMIAGELQGPAEAIAILDKSEGELDPDSLLKFDCGTLRTLYAGESINENAKSRLRTNHGWIGQLAATYGKPDTDPERAPLVGGGGTLMAFLAAVGAGLLLVLLVGFAFFIVAIVKVSGGTLRPRFIPPTPGGSIAIEMVVVFVIGFLALKGVTLALDKVLTPIQTMRVSLIGQWSLLLILLWPRLRGWKGGLNGLGWNRGQGVLTEIGCGLFGYLACLPLVVFGAIISVVLMMAYQGIKMAMGHTPPAAPDNPVFEIASGKAGTPIVVVIYFLAAVWAPIMEETIFRGAFYRHLRSHWMWFPAAAVTAVGFGLMHNYPLLMLGPVMSLGFGFALIREWRGSLIASMTAHCVHNAVVFGGLLLAFYLIG